MFLGEEGFFCMSIQGTVSETVVEPLKFNHQQKILQQLELPNKLLS